MMLSITSFTYLTLSFGLGVLAYRCFETWGFEQKNRAAKLFTYFFAFFALVSFIFGTVSLFGNTLDIIRKASLFIDVLFALGCGVLGYLIIYLRSPKINPWFGFVPIFITGITAAILNLFQIDPYITKTGGINWGQSPLVYILQFSLFLFTFIPISFILFQQSKLSQNSFLQTKAFIFALIALGGFIVSFIELILEPFFNTEETFINEAALILLNVILFTFLLTSEQHFTRETK